MNKNIGMSLKKYMTFKLRQLYKGIGHTYGGDMYLSLTKNGSSIGSVNIEYNEELANQLMEIVKPIIFNKVKMLEKQIDKV